MLREARFDPERHAITRGLTATKQRKMKREWAEKWSADGNAPPENDSLTAKPEKTQEVGEETNAPRRDRGCSRTPDDIHPTT